LITSRALRPLRAGLAGLAATWSGRSRRPLRASRADSAADVGAAAAVLVLVPDLPFLGAGLVLRRAAAVLLSLAVLVLLPAAVVLLLRVLGGRFAEAEGGQQRHPGHAEGAKEVATVCAASQHFQRLVKASLFRTLIAGSRLAPGCRGQAPFEQRLDQGITTTRTPRQMQLNQGLTGQF
jgi:hypothetical protein